MAAMAAMAANEDNITEKHERNIKLYEKLVALIKEIKPKIDEIFNDNLRKYIFEQTKNTKDFDKYKKMFNELVESLPVVEIKNKYNLDNNEINFKLLDKTIKRTIAQI